MTPDARGGVRRIGLRTFVLVYLAIVLVAPLALIFWRAFEGGLGAFWEAISSPSAVHALWLTLQITLIAVPLNTAFGIVAALVIVRRRVPGSRLMTVLIDLPLALSPVVVGLSVVLVWGLRGWWGEWLAGQGVRVVFALPGMVIATVIVCLPFVVREVIPVLREVGVEQEEAAAVLGARPLQTFLRVTLPAIRWGVAYGVVLTTARALGEYGAVAVVSGRIQGTTQTLTLYVDDRTTAFDSVGAYGAAVVLALLSLATVVALSVVRRDEASGER
jgi:sulfate transport system permease protein